MVRRWISTVLALVLPVAILGAGGMAIHTLLATAPQVQRTSEERQPPLVEAVAVERGPFNRTVEAHGAVMPAREVTIRPEVAGRVTEIHPDLEPGGIIAAGGLLLRIDPEQYELALSQAKGALAEAEAALEVEKGRQKVAQREWELFGKDMPNADMSAALALREPQLRQAEARIESARSLVKRAELDLRRTRIQAPFDVLVLEEAVDVGQYLSPGSVVATLVGADVFWAKVAIPADWLEAVLEAARSGRNTACIYAHVDGEDEPAIRGTVIRHLGQLDQGRMAQLLLSVSDPLGVRPDGPPHPPLSLNSYVRAELDAGVLEDAVVIARRGLRENGEVWVADEADRLQVRHVKVLWRQGESLALTDAFEPGDRVVVSPLDNLIPGMEVRVAENPASEAAVTEDEANA